jgi:N-acetyl-gamma-glutamyl-phosphate reductase
VVGLAGFEPTASCPPGKRATRLRHSPFHERAAKESVESLVGKYGKSWDEDAVKRIKTAIVGASGYTGMELLRSLLTHPAVELCAVTSRAEAGKEISQVFPRFSKASSAALCFSEPDPDLIQASGAEVAFLALPHGVAAEIASALLARGIKVIDLSADFRLRSAAVYEEFYGHPHPAPALLAEAVYGLPEIRAEEIRNAKLIASPGCYPTSIILPLLPLLRNNLIDHQTIVANSMSGVSGAGRKADLALLFCECQGSARAYGVPKHRHLSEIEQELSIAAGEEVVVSFLPHLIPVHSGIATTTTAKLRNGVDPETIGKALHAAYAEATFVRLLGRGKAADTKMVTGTNFIDIGWEYDSRTNRIILMSAEDNLGKGAGGQAIQSFNMMHDLPQETGLNSW